MRTRRNELGISAAAVADRTKRLGYPITRSTIAKIESGSRASKLDLTELLILALALQTTPAALMFSDAPDGESRVFPAAPRSPRATHTNGGAAKLSALESGMSNTTGTHSLASRRSEGLSGFGTLNTANNCGFTGRKARDMATVPCS
ncbi:helix-turn-helix domain-containing protein [Dietzia aerolata]|uniref:helix-turn-helix domain-containing protein n=1 Tax=Dietzia aerolata TaxID=595984 RepID=UPI003638B3EB